MQSEPMNRRTTGGAIAITGSKGGVGKSNLVVNLAVALGRLGRRVLIVDGDLGLANVDVLLGLVPPRTVEHLVRGEARLEDLLVDGPSGVRVLPAASGLPRMTLLSSELRGRLVEALSDGHALADEVLVDTGAGLGEVPLALQLAAEQVVVVTTPEPTSLVDAYATIKVLWDAAPDKPTALVVNNAAGDDEALTAYEKIARACHHFLERQPEWLGAVYHDPELPQAVMRQRALSELYPSSRAARCYERIALRIAAGSRDVPAGEFWSRLMAEAGRELTH